MPVTETPKERRSVSFAPNLIDSREEDEIIRQTREMTEDTGAGIGSNHDSSQSLTDSATTSESLEPLEEQQEIDDGTGRRFKVSFQEHRLRFDQTFPEGLEMRIPEAEFAIVLEQIHRDLIKPLDKGQKSVRKWSLATAGTAPIGVGFFLSIFLARRVNHHQKSFKNFWISLRSHLKALNRDIYYARGIEWRIERDLEKVADRDSYNKLHAFRIEIIFRKPIVMRSGREAALRSIIEAPQSERSSSASSGISRFSNLHLADPELFALLSTVPGGDEYTYSSNFGNENNSSSFAAAPDDAVVTDTTDREVYSSPFLVPDHMVEDETTGEPLFIKVAEPKEVTEARSSSVFEPPSPAPAASLFSTTVETKEEDGTGKVSEETKKMTFADLLRSNLQEEQKKEGKREGKQEQKREGISTSTATTTATATAASAAVVGMTAAMAAATLTRSPSPPDSAPPVNSVNKVTEPSREEAFAQRQRKKFSRNPTFANQLYAIPESPTLPTADPAGDAMNYLNAPEGQQEELIEDILEGIGINGSGDDQIRESLLFFENKPVRVNHLEDDGDNPVAAYPMADPFAALYETEETTPLDPLSSDSESEFTEVDGESEYVRRKKWRVAPENADKLSRVQTVTETIHPSSRRTTYLPMTKSVLIPDKFEFTKEKREK